MQQHLMQMQAMMAAYYPNNVTTDHIQQYLDENKSLILKIVESQSSGKLSECAENQSRLQRNLMFLAAIADSQPQPPAMPGQYPASGIMQQGAHYMQAQQMAHQQQQLMAARSSLLYAQHQPLSALQQQQATLHLHSQLGGMSSTGSSGLHILLSEASKATIGGGGGGGGGFPDFVRTGKQEIGGAGQGGSSGGHAGEGGETLYLKSADDYGN